MVLDTEGPSSLSVFLYLQSVLKTIKDEAECNEFNYK